MAIYSKLRDLTSLEGLQIVHDSIWRHSCPICRAPSTQSDVLCLECWEGLHRIYPPFCEYCGAAVEGEHAQICLACYDQPRAWDAGGCAVQYSGTGRTLILRLKNMSSEELAQVMARLSFDIRPDLFEDVDMLIPIPLHWSKHLMRGFNQAELLAMGLGDLAGVRLEVNLLKRRRATKAQSRLKDYSARFDNLASAFRLNHPECIEGKHVLLVDDVLTSGASFENAAHVLRWAKPRKISVFAFARAA